MKKLFIPFIGSLLFLGCDQPTTSPSNRSLKDVTTTTTSTTVDKDNSGINKRDRDTTTKTPFDQNENQSDINITANIRKSVVDTKMSTNAQNVKIITQDGVVTLRGPVKTQEEKTRIEELARNVAGVKSVDSQLEIEKNP